MLQNPHVWLTFEEARNPLRLPRETTSEPPKVVRTPSVLYILTWKCASHHNGVHFFEIWISKSGPKLVCFVHFDFKLTFSTSQLPKVVRSWCVYVCFVHFDFKMCFAPERCALFRHLNFQKWSGPGVFCTFWLANVLRATTACNFSCLIWPAGSAPAALASLLFDPPGPQIIGKTQCFAVSRLSYLFAHLRLLSSDSFSSLIFSLLLSLFSLPLPCSAFHLSILSEVWLLNLLRSLKYMFPPVKAAHGYRWFHMKRSKLAALIVCEGWLMYCMCTSVHKHM